jgi:hypothetical protein
MSFYTASVIRVDIAMSALSSAIHNTGHYHGRPRPVCLPPSCIRSANNGHRRCSSGVLTLVDLANMTLVRPPKNWNNRSPATRGDRRARCIFIGPGDDDRRLSPDEISSQQRQAVVLPLRIAIFDCYALVFDVARFGQGPEKCRQIRPHRSWRSGMKKPDQRHRALLRPRGHRPRGRCAPEQRDEVATLQSIELHLLPQPGTS